MLLGAANDLDGIAQAWIAWTPNGLKVIKRPEDVVMPARREREAKEDRFDDGPGAMRAKQPVHEQEFLAAFLGGSNVAREACGVVGVRRGA